MCRRRNDAFQHPSADPLSLFCPCTVPTNARPSYTHSNVQCYLRSDLTIYAAPLLCPASEKDILAVIQLTGLLLERLPSVLSCGAELTVMCGLLRMATHATGKHRWEEGGGGETVAVVMQPFEYERRGICSDQQLLVSCKTQPLHAHATRWVRDPRACTWHHTCLIHRDVMLQFEGPFILPYQHTNTSVCPARGSEEFCVFKVDTNVWRRISFFARHPKSLSEFDCFGSALSRLFHLSNAD